MAPEAPITQADACFSNTDQISGKMGLSCPNQPQQIPTSQHGQQTTTEQQTQPQGQSIGPDGKPRPKKDGAMFPVKPKDMNLLEQFMPKNEWPKPDDSICFNAEYPIPVCAKVNDAIILITGPVVGDVAVLIPCTALPCDPTQVTWCCQEIHPSYTHYPPMIPALINPFMLVGINCLGMRGGTSNFAHPPASPPPPKTRPKPFGFGS